MCRLHQITEPTESSDSDTATLMTTCHTGFQSEAITAFYIECAELAGVELSEWLDSEPF